MRPGRRCVRSRPRCLRRRGYSRTGPIIAEPGRGAPPVDAWRHASTFFLLGVSGAALDPESTRRSLPVPRRDARPRAPAARAPRALGGDPQLRPAERVALRGRLRARRSSGFRCPCSAWRAASSSRSPRGGSSATAEEGDSVGVELPHVDDASRAAFFPLTMPITAGPGTISVAIALGTQRGTGVDDIAVFALGATATTTLICAIVVRRVPLLAGALADRRPHRHRDLRAALGVPAVLHRRPGPLERRRGAHRGASRALSSTPPRCRWRSSPVPQSL